MCENPTVSPRVVIVLLWIEHRIGQLRRLVDRPPRLKVSGPPPEPELFDRRDLRAKW
ncbi:MAG TPA: hypothetical protein VMF91_27355 [Bryobacteraceae bacterium]|nr:hypothetical protein [Bryobacteraceae bacterium]